APAGDPRHVANRLRPAGPNQRAAVVRTGAVLRPVAPGARRRQVAVRARRRGVTERHDPEPRALPWAEESRPFGALSRRLKACASAAQSIALGTDARRDATTRPQ